MLRECDVVGLWQRPSDTSRIVALGKRARAERVVIVTERRVDELAGAASALDCVLSAKLSVVCAKTEAVSGSRGGEGG